MSSPVFLIWPLLLLGGLVIPGVRHVMAIEIKTPGEVEAVNGTDVKLKCTFTSTHELSSQSVTVSWNFRPLDSKHEESVFYFQETPYPPQHGRFKGHAVWSGDVSRGDASITLHEVPPNFNGTFICQVRNRPDVHGQNGEIFLKVVNKSSLSDISLLAAIVGGACGVILLIFGIFLGVRFCRARRMEHDFEMQPSESESKRKDPTVCAPEEAVHLRLVKKKKESVSSDDEESEASSGDDEEEDDGEEEDDDDDDEDDDDDDDFGDDDGGGDD